MTDVFKSHIDIPSPGEIVEVRKRRWVVSKVQGQSALRNEEHDLVSLSSLDEDSLGKELHIIWQIEPGARILNKLGMPDISGYDSEEKAEAFLNAVRWGAVTKAKKNFLQSPFRSGISIEDYQLEPLVRSIDMPRVNLLIADDVGLGKTIETGLIVQEMLIRHRARTVFILCPSSLQLKWETEMREKFGLEFRIVDTDYIKRLRRQRGIHANPWTSFPRLISSMDWMKAGEGLRLIKDCLPHSITYPRKFDILILDEAHNVAPATAYQYALESQRTRLIRMLAPHFEHRLFLSATPHNGYQESFTSLLELLDDQRFSRSILPSEKQLKQVMVRRLKTDLSDKDGKPRYPQRKIMFLEIDYTEEERRIHKLLDQFTASRSKTVRESRFEYSYHFVHKLLKKRLFSSPMAFEKTLTKHKETLKNLKRKEKEKKDPFEDKILKKLILRAEEDFVDDEHYEMAQEEAIEKASRLSIPLTDEESIMLEEMSTWAEKMKARIDSKGKAIIKWIKEHLTPNGEWNEKRVILFTEFRATHIWMRNILGNNGFTGERIAVMHGGMNQEEREKVTTAFQTNPNICPLRILLATDTASEGIDLQNYCNYIIHIEIPWNPNVMEQRNGRIDRHGQKASEVFIWHPVVKGFQSNKSIHMKDSGQAEGDLEFLMRAVFKVDKIRSDLGAVGSVIAKQIEEAMLGKRTVLDTRIEEEKIKKAKKHLYTGQAELKKRISELHEKIIEAKTDYHLSPENIYKTVAIALEIAGKEPLKAISFPDIPDGKVFEVPNSFTGTWASSTVGLAHPYTGEKRPITFDHDIAKERDDIVLVHLNHRLVQICLRLLREELWKTDEMKKLHRVTFRKVPDHLSSTPVVIIQGRLLITGADHLLLHEDIILSGGELLDKKFKEISTKSHLEELLKNSEYYNPSDSNFELLEIRFKKHKRAIHKAMEEASEAQLNGIRKTLNKRKEKEISNLKAILDELDKMIFEELEKDKKDKQIHLLEAKFKDEPIRKDISALENRRKRIPEERAKEIEIIERRYKKLEDRTFPVAVIILVPESLSE